LGPQIALAPVGVRRPIWPFLKDRVVEGLGGFFLLGWVGSIVLRHYVWGEPWFRWR
jgi:hypothetical protein